MIVSKFIKFVIFVALTVVLSVLISQFGSINHASAADTPVTGWMWSDNTGWVSLNCTNTNTCATNAYGVAQDTNGNWTGYGWSDNLGWLKFNAGCPSGMQGQCNTAKVTGNTLRGFARFCAGSSDGACGAGSRADGWDGWVSFSDQNDHDPNTSGVQTSSFAYGPVLNGTTMSGYAWGSTVVGWLQLVNVTVGSPTSSLQLVISTTPFSGAIQNYPSSVQVGTQTGNVYLGWFTADNTYSYSSCAATSTNSNNNWNGLTLSSPQPLPGYEHKDSVGYNLNIANPAVYTLNCTRTTGGIDTATAQVSSTVPDCVVNLSGGGPFCASGPNAHTPQLTWNASSASDCTAAWFTGTNATNKPTSGSQVVGSGSYQVSCHTQGTGNVCTSNTEVVTQLPSNDSQCTTIPGNGGSGTGTKPSVEEQ